MLRKNTYSFADISQPTVPSVPPVKKVAVVVDTQPTFSRPLVVALVSLLVASGVLLLIAVAGGGGIVEKRFSLWSNAALAWPVVHAVAVGADAEALVILVACVVSTFHHGCLVDDTCRLALATETYVVVALVLVGVVAAATYVLCGRARSPQSRACLGASAGVATLAVLVAAGVALGETPETLDGCLLYHADPLDTSYVSALVTLWASADVVTALVTLVAVLVYLAHVGRSLELGLVWTYGALVVVLVLYRNAGYLTSSTIYATLGLVLVASLVVRVIACCTLPRSVRDAVWQSYRLGDLVAGVLIGVVALVLFFVSEDATTSSVHGLWHVLVAAALVLVVDGRRRLIVID